MPITYEIERTLIRTRCAGDVRLYDVLEHFRILERDSSRPDRLNVLLDLSEMTSLPEPQQLRQVSQEIARVSSAIQFGICAIVATHDALFGLIRMFEVFAENYFRATEVFRSIEEANEWLRTTLGHDLDQNGILNRNT